MILVRPTTRVGSRQVLATLALLLASCTAPRASPRGIGGSKVEKLSGAVRVGGEYKHSRINDDPAFERTLLREEIEAAIQGRIYDARLLRYMLGATLRFTQDRDSASDQGFQNLLLPRYAARVDLLPRHATPATLYASRSEDRTIVESRESSPLVETITEEAGARIGLRGRTLTGEFEYRYNSLDTTGLTSDRDQSTDLARISILHRPSARIRTTLRVAWEAYREAFSRQSYETPSISLLNIIRAGDLAGLDRFVFTTSANARVRSGTTEYTSANFFEDVFWRVLPELDSSTRYNFQLYQATNDTRTHSIEQTLLHRLFDSLETTGGVRYLHSSIDEGQQRQSGWNAGVNYRKQTPAGPLHLGYGYSLLRQENELVSPEQQVLEEPHVLSSGNLALLANTDVIPESIVVRDASGAVTYTEGLDYSVIQRGRLTELVRVPGGLITEGQTVLVDYRYVVPTDFTFDTKHHRFAADLLVVGAVRLYTRYDRMRQEPVSGEGAESLEDSDTWVVGVEYARWGLRASAEFVLVESTSTPYEQQRYELGYGFSPSQRLHAGVATTHQETDFADEGSQRTTSITGRVAWRPTSAWTLRFLPVYHVERGRGFDRNVLDLRFDVRYLMGKFELIWTLHHNTLDQPDRISRQTYTTLMLERRW